MAIVLSFLSDYRPGTEKEYKIPDDDRTIKGTYTNEAPVKYLIEKARNDNPDEPIKVIFLVSKKVNDEKVFNDDFSIAEKDSKDKYLGEKNLFQYYCNSFEREESTTYKNVIPDFIRYDFIGEKAVIGESKIIANELYHNISKKIKDEKSVYIDYTGGFRDTSYLMVSLIQYLNIVGVDCKCIVYSNYQNKTIYKINYIYRINEILQGANDFISTGSIARLKKYFNTELNDKSTNDSDELTKVKNILTNIDAFTKAISLGQISKLDEIKDSISESLTAIASEKTSSSLSINIFSLLLPIIKRSLHIDKDDLDYPEIVEWCVEHGYIQQAFTIYVEKIPKTYLESGIGNLPLQKLFNRSNIDDSEKFYTNFWDSLPLSPEDDFAKKILAEFKTANPNNAYKYFSMYDIDASLRFTKTEKEKINELKELLDNYDPFIGFDYLGFKKVGDESIAKVDEKSKAIKISKARNSLFNEMLTNSTKLAYYLLDKGADFEQAQAYVKKLSALDKKNLTYKKKITIAQNLQNNAMLKSAMQMYLGIKIMRNHMNHAADTTGDIPTEVEKTILCSEGILQNEENNGDIFNYDNAVALIKKGVKLTKALRDNNTTLITIDEYNEIRV